MYGNCCTEWWKTLLYEIETIILCLVFLITAVKYSSGGGRQFSYNKEFLKTQTPSKYPARRSSLHLHLSLPFPQGSCGGCG